jgi:DNA gyrase inhibitor GyrI
MATEAHRSVVQIRDLPPHEVVCLTCQVDQATGQFSSQISDGFGQIKQWAAHHGIPVAECLFIGIPHVVERQLIAYDCCVQIPDSTVPPPEGWDAKPLPGGRYAVLTLDKDPATLGERIGRFFAEYVPQHQLRIDAARPGYEIYYAQTMDYCVPIQ